VTGRINATYLGFFKQPKEENPGVLVNPGLLEK